MDVSLNKPFKNIVRETWNKWMVDTVKSITKGGEKDDLLWLDDDETNTSTSDS